MAVSRVQTSSILQGFPKSRSLLAGNSAYIPTAFESIATITASGSTSVLTFNSIPQTYKHLHLRGNAFIGTAGFNINAVFNNDYSNYAYHDLGGNGSSISAGGTGTTDRFYLGFSRYDSTVATYPNVTITDIFDYTSNVKNKTVRSLSGADNNSTGGSVTLSSGLWANTSAVTRIDIICGINFSSTTTFALYGVK
jgi:hypothetical protein